MQLPNFAAITQYAEVKLVDSGCVAPLPASILFSIAKASSAVGFVVQFVE